MHNIITTLKALAEVLGRIGAPCMVIGGLANMVWGTALPYRGRPYHPQGRFKTPQRPEDIRGIVTRRGTKLDRAYLLPIIRKMAELLERPDLYGLCRELEQTGEE